MSIHFIISNYAPVYRLGLYVRTNPYSIENFFTLAVTDNYGNLVKVNNKLIKFHVSKAKEESK